MTYLNAALTILTYTDRPLSVGELTAVAVAQGLVRPRGRTPDRSMSSILYRRMASDPDAPFTATGGRFWLRGRPMPAKAPLALRPAVRHVRRAETRGVRPGVTPPRPSRRRSVLPAPPIQIPPPSSLPGELATPHEGLGAGRRERAVARIARGLPPLVARVAPLWPAAQQWDAERTRARLVAPLLTLLGYRRSDQQAHAPVRGRVLRLLLAGDAPAILLEAVRASSPLADADARPTVARAVASGVRWALLTNGRELRLYSTRVSGALADPGRALVLRIDAYDWADDATRLDAARTLWLLSRDAVAKGALDAYLAARAVGASLLAALEDPRSPLIGALAEAVRAATGLDLPPTLLIRHARLAVRNPRSRDGEPLPADIPAVAAIPAPSGDGALEAADDVPVAS